MNITKAILVSFIIAIILMLVVILIEMILNPPTTVSSVSISIPISILGPRC